ncbi:ATP synthase subunit I [Amphibacillus sp. MSJ-3]|uniref:ATP synthase subunit I n=1 Tax=Amphibacillus sp. MSJ-3 TaxID=2841505 RepID=UPI001C0EA156|nr:ATP synthase subunit I [Amphibacillus sp. MSJ-3]MBU5594865.1 ATP synthase subunit I [Amphibacillus sp. MSJ-3]
MEDYQKAVQRQRKWHLNVLLIVISGTLVTLGNRTWLGLLLGSIASYANLLLLQRQVDQIGQVAIGEKKHAMAGTIFRIGSALLVVYLAKFIPLEVNFYSLVIGLVLKDIIIMLDAFVQIMKNRATN